MAGGIPGIAIKIMSGIEEAVGKLSLAKTLKLEAAKLESEAKPVLLDKMNEEFKNYTSEKGYGSVVYVPAGKSKKFDKKKAAQMLLAKGVSADVIHDVWEASTKEDDRDAYIKYTPEQGE
jgi:SOS response regulatory protein OraA/RecX